MDYLDYHDIQLVFFTWDVADAGYCWDDTARAGDLGKPGEPPFLVESPSTSSLFPYNPMDKQTLFLQFAETPLTKEGILQFANVHGKLHPTHDVLVSRPGKDNVLLRADSLSLWIGEIWYMKTAVQLWEWIKEKNWSALGKIISWDEHKKSVEYSLPPNGGASGSRSWGVLASPQRKPEIFARCHPGEVLLPARHLLQMWINKRLERYPVKPRLLMNAQNALEGRLIPSSLLSAMWLQFYLATIGETKYKRCAVCGHWSDVTGKNRNWTMHPDCANKARVKKWSEKNKKK